MSGIMIVFDLTRQESFDNVKKWLHEIELFAPVGVCKVLVGNKKDLATERQVESATAKDFADQLQIPYIETSAKDNISVDQAFKTLATEISCDRVQQHNSSSETLVNTRHSKGGSERGLRKLRLPLLILFATTSIFLVYRHFPRILRIIRRH